MNCTELEQSVESVETLTHGQLQHIRNCKRCMEKYGLPHLLLTISDKKTCEISTPTNEDNFFAKLQLIGEAQQDSYQRAQFLNQSVQKGDRLFWQGDYAHAAKQYRQALMIVTDEQGRAALHNKLARTQIHRQQGKEAIYLLTQALIELGEPPPSSSLPLLAIWQARFDFWVAAFRQWLAQQWPSILATSTRYGDRSRAVQHLYRELAILAQSEDPLLSQWAHWHESRWAVKLQQPLEQIVAWGRKAVQSAQRNQNWRANYWSRKIEALASKQDDPFTSASADFYIGRTAYLSGRWEQARFHLARCVEYSQSAQDAYLRDAALQHLIRVYRNDGNFAEALRVASQLLLLYHKLGNLSRLSACCRHFALIYAAYGELRRANQWAMKAFEVANNDASEAQEHSLSIMRCHVLLGDLELRCGHEENAQLHLEQAINIQRSFRLPEIYIRDGMAMLNKLLGKKNPSSRFNWWQRLYRWFTSKLAIMQGDLERAHHLQQNHTRFHSQEHLIPSELAYLYQEYTLDERPGGLREAIPASNFAQDFLTGTHPIQPEQASFSVEADQLASMFPVGAVSSRWGRGALARDRTGAITAQITNGKDAPWGYFFADDIS